MAQYSVVWAAKSRYCEHQNFNRIIFYKRDLDIEFHSIWRRLEAPGLSLYMVGIESLCGLGSGAGPGARVGAGPWDW